MSSKPFTLFPLPRILAFQIRELAREQGVDRSEYASRILHQYVWPEFRKYLEKLDVGSADPYLDLPAPIPTKENAVPRTPMPDRTPPAEPVKITRSEPSLIGTELLQHAMHIAEMKEISIYQYLDEVLRPTIMKDLVEERRKKARGS